MLTAANHRHMEEKGFVFVPAAVPAEDVGRRSRRHLEPHADGPQQPGLLV